MQKHISDNMKNKYLILIIFPLLFSSCNTASGWGIIAIVALFALMLISFGAMFYLIFRKKRQASKSLAKFRNDLNISLQKFNTPEQKAGMLQSLIKRIEEDETYKKDEDWKNKVLVCALQPLAAAYYKMGNEAKALGVCTQIIELEPDHIMSHYNRGSMYSDMGMYDKAIKDFDRTIELMPGYASAYNNRGLVYEKLQQYDRAIEDYNKAIELEDSPISHFNRANTYLTMGYKDKALEDYNYYLQLDPDNNIGLRDEVEEIIVNMGQESQH